MIENLLKGTKINEKTGKNLSNHLISIYSGF